MKDESRAKWPEHMIGTRIVDDDGRRVYIICGQGTHDASVWSEDTETIEARAKQVRALPAMVALLKLISEQSLFFENEDGYYETTEFHDTAKSILAQIGEGE